jgi:PAS domain S-box-containing protein
MEFVGQMVLILFLMYYLLGRGERESPVMVSGVSELEDLAHAFETMAENVRLREIALRESEEWLRVTLSSIGDAVIATDTAARITFVNPVAANLTGWVEDETRGRAIEEVFQIINEKTRKPAEDIVRRVLRDGRVVNLANHTALITRDGREIPLRTARRLSRTKSATWPAL